MINFAIGFILGTLVFAILTIPNNNYSDGFIDEQEAKRDEER